MRKIYLLIIFICLTMTSPAVPAVLFNLGIEEGAFITAGNVYFVNNISSDLAYIQPLSPRISLIGYYQMKYSGPGIGDSAETKFSERSQDHYFMLKPIIKLNKDMVLKPNFNFFKEFYKFGKNEQWGGGLYDYNKYEAGADFVYLKLGFPITLTGKYQAFKYPNYSDLLTLYLTGFSKEEPQEDYNNLMGSVSVNDLSPVRSFFIFFDYTLNSSLYGHKKVLEANGYTGSDNQKVTHHQFTLLPQYKAGKFLFSLHFMYEINRSNQNYIFGTDPQNIVWLENYYSYGSLNLKPYITLLFSKEKYLSLVFSYFDKKFTGRPAQDFNGAFLSSKTEIQSLSLGLLYHVKLSNYFSLSPSYLYARSTSNSEYQKAISYNYNAHLISLRLNYEY
jgi:hypothetical protein